MNKNKTKYRLDMIWDRSFVECARQPKIFQLSARLRVIYVQFIQWLKVFSKAFFKIGQDNYCFGSLFVKVGGSVFTFYVFCANWNICIVDVH